MSEGLFQQRPTDPPQGEAAAAALGWVPLLEDLPLGLLLVDAAGNPVALNAAACRLLATDRETLVALDARAFLDRLVTSTGTRLATQGIAALAGQEPGATMRLGWVPATAGIAWLDLSAKTLQGGGVLLSLKEAPLDPGQDLFAKVFRACPDGITISSMEDGTYLEVNEVMLNQMGMSRDQVVGHSSLELDVWVNPEDRLRYLEELSRTGSVRNFETRFRTRAGRILPFEVSSEIIQVQGKPYSFNFMRDLTTARELVKGRQESEAKFRLLFEQAPLGMAVVETETGHFRSVNHRLGTIIGCEAASLIGRSFQEFTHPDDLAADVRSVQDLAIGNVKEVEKEKRYINGLGKVVWGRLKMVKLPPAPDGTARHLSLVEDITAHKEAEDALRDSQTRLQRAESVAAFGNWELNLQDGIMNASRGAHLIYGLPQHALALADVQALVLPEHRQALDAALKALVEQGKPYRVEFRIRRADDGELRSLQSVAQYDADRRTVFGVIHDITEMKRIDDALRESEFLFRESQRAAMIGSYKADFVSGTWTSSEVLDDIFGIDNSYVRSIQGWLGLIHPDDQGMMEDYLQTEVVAGHRPFARQYRIIRPRDGAVRWVQGLGKGTFDHEGGFRALVGTIQDITERKLAEDSLRESEARFRSYLLNAPIGVFECDEKGRYLQVNPAASRITGYTQEELLRMSIPELLPEAEWPNAGSQFQRLLETGYSYGELQFKRKDGGLGTWSVEAVRLSHDRALGFVSDISERLRNEQEKAELQLQLNHSQKMESLGNLASGIAHDMNNVLGAILGLSSAQLSHLPQDHPLYQTLSTIREAATRGGGVVRSLLTFARPSPREQRIVDVNELLLEVARLLERTTLAKVRLELDLAPDLRSIHGDAGELSHVVMNLCINAVDAMGEHGTLVLGTRNVNEAQVEVTVEDTGCGMPPAVLARAMDPFFTTKEVGKGTGLGLTMVFATVKAHGGEVALRSVVGQGTVVSLRFPAVVTRDLEVALRVPEQASGGRASLSILLVDDDDLIQKSSRMLLEVIGHQVTAAISGEAALALLDQGLCPDAVILDMNMPGLGGKGTLPRLRAICPTVPVFLATGRADHQAMDLVAAHPFVTLLPKPFSFEELRDHLQRVRRQDATG